MFLMYLIYGRMVINVPYYLQLWTTKINRVSDEILDLYSLLVINDFMIFNHNVYNIVVSLSISHVYG